MGVKDGPRLVLDYLATFQLIGYPAFWAALPPDVEAELRPAAAEARGKAADAAVGRPCSGCGTVRSIMVPVHNALWGRLGDLYGVMPNALDNVVGVVTEKRGYRPRPVAVYYTDGAGTPRTLTL